MVIMNATPRQACIYLIQGPSPGLEYVGVTATSIRERLYRHRSRALRDGRSSKLYSAMREHGIDNFHIQTLESVRSEDAHMAERRHILARESNTKGLNSQVPRLLPQRPLLLEPSQAGTGPHTLG